MAQECKVRCAQAEFEGMIRFVSQPQLAAEYLRLVDGAGLWKEQQRRAQLLFRERFAPEQLFTRAQIYSEWNLELDT